MTMASSYLVERRKSLHVDYRYQWQNQSYGRVNSNHLHESSVEERPITVFLRYVCHNVRLEDRKTSHRQLLRVLFV